MTKNEMIELAIEYSLMDSERDLENVAIAMNEDDFADFIGFLFLGDWSRNITVLDKELQEDSSVVELFNHIEAHCKK